MLLLASKFLSGKPQVLDFKVVIKLKPIFVSSFPKFIDEYEESKNNVKSFLVKLSTKLITIW